MAKTDFPSPQPTEYLAQTDLLYFRKSSIHGTGGFARCGIPEQTRVIEYVGERIDKRESLRRCEQNNEYIFTLNEQYDLDGNVEGNLARFLNHSCTPNCEAEVGDDQIWIVTSRDVRAGEELTFNYGFDLEDYQQYICHCRSPHCVGYMVAEEFFDHVSRQGELRNTKEQ